MFDDDDEDDDETTPEHIKRLRAERAEYETWRSNASREAGAREAMEWVAFTHYSDLKDFVEQNTETDWADGYLPELGWEAVPENGDGEAYFEGFYEAARAVLEKVEAG